MKKQTLLLLLLILNICGIISAVIVLANSNNGKQQKESALSISGFSSFPGTMKKDGIIGVIYIDGPISFSTEDRSLLFTKEKGASLWLSQMKNAETNENIKAVIIRVNSPGGTVGASQELHAGVKRIKAAGKPVITSVADLSASGGYYATVASDKIFANPGSLIGSIGVILGSVEFSKLLEKLGITYQAITSGINKDILSPFKKLSEQQRAFLQTMVSNTYEQFLTAVAEGRGRDKSIIAPLADGSVFTGEQAVKNGLIDSLGTFDDVVVYTKQTYNLKNASVEIIPSETSAIKFSDLLSVFAPQSAPKIDVSVNGRSDFGFAPVLYLYQF
ncbi:MAG: signal peptide peptidase SppA [Brevinemataceae bacterium]